MKGKLEMMNHMKRRVLQQATVLMMLSLGSMSIAAETESLGALSDPLDQITWYQQNENAIAGSPEDMEKAKVLHRIGRAYYNTGNSVQAGEMFRSALGIAVRGSSRERFLGALYNDFGLVSVARSDLGQALTYFQQSATAAAHAGDEDTVFVSRLNVVRTLLGTGETGSIARILGELREDLSKLSGSETNIAYHQDLAQLYRESVLAGVLAADQRLVALQLYRAALKSAESRSKKAAVALSNGYIGELYEDEQQLNIALDYTRRALFDAQLDADDLLLYRWQWQLGRILRSQGQIEKSLGAYRQSVASLHRAKSSLSS
ncbi:MAG: tetratricopeptide (TPR) repeat protein, partial [Halieaceae bacterium]